MFGSIFQTFQLGKNFFFTTSCIPNQDNCSCDRCSSHCFLTPSMPHWVRSGAFPCSTLLPQNFILYDLIDGPFLFSVASTNQFDKIESLIVCILLSFILKRLSNDVQFNTVAFTPVAVPLAKDYLSPCTAKGENDFGTKTTYFRLNQTTSKLRTSIFEFCNAKLDRNLSNQDLNLLFNLFDYRRIFNGSEFEAFEKWKTVLTKPKSAFIIMDVQNDFINGSLSLRHGPAKQNPYEVVPAINQLLQNTKFDFIVYSQDWHPDNSISFIDNVNLRPIDPTYNRKPNDMSPYVPRVFDTIKFTAPIETVQRLWPKHCVQNTTGAEFHPDLRVIDDPDRAMILQKGTNPDVDSYSAFWDNNKVQQTRLNTELKRRNITDVYVCGLAYDVCVAYTALDALDLGYKTALLTHCSRGLDIDRIKLTDNQIRSMNGIIVNEQEKIPLLLSGREIPSAWALYVAHNLDKF